MKKINNVLGSANLFDISDVACMLHAKKIASYKPDTTDEPWQQLPREVRFFFKVVFISICHQINWDYLQKKIYEELITKNDNLLEATIQITASTIENWLSDYPKRERIRAKERAKLIRDIALNIQEKFNGDLKYFYCTASALSLQNQEFEKFFDIFEAYRQDPLRKKTNVLSHEIVTEEIYKINDIKNLQPAIDYHIMRIYLRTGRVIPQDQSLIKYLTGAPNPRAYIVSQLRVAVGDALKLTAHYANLNIAETNFIEWQLGRSVCTNSEPACTEVKSISLPPSISSLVVDRCPYINVCEANNLMAEFIKFEEPLFISSNY